MSDDFLDGISPQSVSEIETAASRIVFEEQLGVAYEITFLIPDSGAAEFIRIVNAATIGDKDAEDYVLAFAVFVREQLLHVMELEDDE